MRGAGFAKTAACAIAIVAAAGCSALARKIPDTHRYQLVTPSITAAMPADARIELRSVSGGAPYQDTGLALQTSDYRIDSYRFHRWVAPPTDLVADRIRAIVYAPSAVGPPAADSRIGVLEANIRAFQQVQKGPQSSGLVDIEFCIYPTGIFQRALWCRDFSKDTNAAAEGPEAAAAAINASLTDVLQQFASALPAGMAEIPKPPPDRPGVPPPI